MLRLSLGTKGTGAVLLLTLTACSDQLSGPEPSLERIEPQVICSEQVTGEVVLFGDNLAPTVFTALTTPTLQLPRLELTRVAELDGGASSSATIVVPDDPAHPETSRVQWFSRQSMSFDVGGLGVSPGIWSVQVTNPQGATAILEGALVSTPPPRLDSIEPEQVCAGDAGRDVTLRGADFLVVESDTPIVHLGDVDYASTASDCVELDTPVALRRCSTLTISLPAGLAQGTYAVTVTNPRSAACTTDPIDFRVVPPEPLLLYVDPPVVYDGFPNRLTVYSANFPSDDITRVELVPDVAGSAIPLCDDAGATPCSEFVGTGGSGIFTVTMPAGVLDDLTGSPTEAAFGLRAAVRDASCSAYIAEAVQVVSIDVGATLGLEPRFGKVGERTAVSIALDSTPGPVFVATPRAYLTNDLAGGPLPATAFVGPQNLTAIIPETFSLTCGTDCSESFDLAVLNPDGTLFIQSDAFVLSTFDPPQIDGVNPGQVPASITASVVVSGQHFEPAATVELELCKDELGTPLAGASVNAVIADSDTQLTVEVLAPTDSFQFAACVVRVTNPRDGAFSRFAALVFSTDNSGNIPAPRAALANLGTARQNAQLAAVGATAAARYLYAVAGDDGAVAGALDAVEYAPIDITGELGGTVFIPSRHALVTPRSHHGLVAVGRALYAIGGVDAAGNGLASVERAVVLDPDEVLQLRVDDFALGTASDPGLAPGALLYQATIVFAPDDPINPCGESLASDPFVVRIPELEHGLSMTLGWDAPDTTAGSGRWANRQVAGFRLYRPPAPDAAATELALYAELDGAAATSFTDTGVGGAAGAISACVAVPPQTKPPALGETSRWVALDGSIAGNAVLSLATARAGAGVRSVADPASNQVHVYAMGGVDRVGVGAVASDSYEVLTLSHDAAENPIAWEAAASWTEVASALPNVAGCDGARWQAGLFGFDRSNSSYDGAPGSFEIVDDSQFLYLGPGLDAAGGGQGTFQSWHVDVSTGLLDGYDGRCVPSAATGAYGQVGANRQVFTFGGTSSPNAIRAVSWQLLPGSPPQISIGNEPYQANGAGLPFSRSAHAAVLERAYIYLAGGWDGAAVTSTVIQGLW